MSAKSRSTWQIYQPWPFARSVCLTFRCGRRRRGSGERFDGAGEEADMSPTRLFIDERNREEELSYFQLACFNLLGKLNGGGAGGMRKGGEIAKRPDLG
jgi:hypothetical protein